MNNILTAHEVFLIDAHTNPPKAGSNVMALTIGGTLVKATWGRNSLQYYDAWCKIPKVPESVKERQLARYAPKGEE